MFADTLIAKFGLTRRANAILLVVNVVGAMLYLWRTSLSWAIPEEKGLNSMTAEPFIWVLAALPVLAIALVINVAWGVIILRQRQWNSGRLWLAVATIWLVAIAIDFAHH
jgi:hypothetical protein